jgi:hypothetical protein
MQIVVDILRFFQMSQDIILPQKWVRKFIDVYKADYTESLLNAPPLSPFIKIMTLTEALCHFCDYLYTYKPDSCAHRYVPSILF